MQKKRCTFLLVILAVFFFTSPLVQASIITPFYSHTDSIYCSFSISKGVASCSGSVTPSSSLDKASVVVKLQQKDGNSWPTIASWSDSADAGMTAYASGAKSLFSGNNTYRVAVYGTIKDSNGNVLESPSKISDTKKY